MDKQLNYARQLVEDDDIEAVVSVLRSDWLTQGPMVQRFEAAVCEFVGAKYAVAVNSGTAALHCAYAALRDLYGVRTINTTPLTFVATANAAYQAGLEVRFYDVCRERGMLIREAYQTDSTVATVPVHFAGDVAPIPRIGSGMVVEDACHAFGARDKYGYSVGSCLDSLACCFSLHPVKPITTGEGGIITTNDEGIADYCRSFRTHGREDAKCVRLGWNYRMSDIAAALGLSQLRKCDRLRDVRDTLAHIYDERLPDWVERPVLQGEGSWHLYAARVPADKRAALRGHLLASGIGAQVHYGLITSQPFWAGLAGDTPNAKDWADRELSLPLHVGMSPLDVERVCIAIECFK
jgi:dTDP-4-amino-4,6-dideoxygalactose transaminase